jgi:rRNA processing protein Krr1/Pno1
LEDDACGQNETEELGVLMFAGDLRGAIETWEWTEKLIGATEEASETVGTAEEVREEKLTGAQTETTKSSEEEESTKETKDERTKEVRTEETKKVRAKLRVSTEREFSFAIPKTLQPNQSRDFLSPGKAFPR